MEGKDSEGYDLIDVSSSMESEALHIVSLDSLGFRINGHRGNRRSSVFSRLFVETAPHKLRSHLSCLERSQNDQEKTVCITQYLTIFTFYSR